MSAGQRARDTANEAEQAGRKVQNTKAFHIMVTVGLIAYGVVHLLVAWISVQIAWGGGGEEASQKGAFQKIAATPMGDVLLWITALGLFALAVWQVFEAGWGHQDREEGRKRIVKRIGSAGKAVLYVVLGVSAVSTAMGSASSGETEKKSMTASLMSATPGRILVIAIGVAIMVVGGRLIYRGVAKRFTRDLRGGVAEPVIRLGQVGYTAKGVVLGIVGILVALAAITFDPDKAGGMDTALRTLREQPYGSVLLTIVAAGLACFGVYCFAWSRQFKQA